MRVAPSGGSLFPIKPGSTSCKYVLFPSKWLKSLFHLIRHLHRLHRLLMYKFNKLNKPKWRDKISRKLRTWRVNIRYLLGLFPSLVLCLVVAGRLVCPYEPQSCIGGSLVLLVGLTMPGRSVGEEFDKAASWPSRLGVGHGVSNPTP